jgi:hypothetical protein
MRAPPLRAEKVLCVLLFVCNVCLSVDIAATALDYLAAEQSIACDLTPAETPAGRWTG